MTIPSVMFIEMAMDSLKSRDPKITAAETKEFNCLGSQRMEQIMDSVPGGGIPDGNPMLAGYLLGLETARVLLATNAKAVQAEVSI